LINFYFLGEIVGPVVGGALYEIGGFVLPFAVMGSILFLSSIFIYFILPDTPQPPPTSNRFHSLIEKMYFFEVFSLLNAVMR